MANPSLILRLLEPLQPLPEGLELMTVKDTMRLLHITTVPESLAFLRGQVGYMQARGFEVHAASSPGDLLSQFSVQERVTCYAVDMPRRITPIGDLIAVFRIVRLIQRLRPTIVHAHTPKGGLLGSIAAWLARVPVRIYHMRGLPFMTARGWRRGLLWWTEKISCSLAHEVYCVSDSLRKVAVDEGICSADKVQVFLGGSGNGVDAQKRFNPELTGEQARIGFRRDLGIPSSALVLGFVGRVVRDKGLVELVQAWQGLRDQFPSLHLLVVGPLEPHDPLPYDTMAALQSDPRVHMTGKLGETALAYAAMDLLVLPTYREGFPNVLLEAASMGLAVVATRVPGCVDAVADRVTGVLVPPQDADSLANAIRLYLADPQLRWRHGSAGRKRVVAEFRQEAIWNAVCLAYMRLLRDRGLDLPGDGPHPLSEQR